MDFLVAFLLFVIFVPKAVPVKYSNVFVRASLFALAITILSSTTWVNRENVQSVTQQCLTSCASETQTQAAEEPVPPPVDSAPPVVAAPPPSDCTKETCYRFGYNDSDKCLPDECYTSTYYGAISNQTPKYVFDCADKYHYKPNGDWCPRNYIKKNNGGGDFCEKDSECK